MVSMELPIYSEITTALFKEKILERQPFIVRNVDIGLCKNTWTFESVAAAAGDKPVKVHVTDFENMDFIEKNFTYKTLPFNELITRVNQETQSNYFVSPGERYYLRCLGFDARGRDVANLEDQWPELACDISFPEVFSKEQLFSSVLRVSSSNVRLWTHYDVMDNILIQIRGRKEVILWHPKEVDNLYLIGDKSKVLDVRDPDLKLFPNFPRAVQHVGTMEEGDILYIPAYWFHNTFSLSPSIAVNVFWKNLNPSLYDAKDPYGNKDLIPAAKALLATKNAKRALEVLPVEYQSFYLRRMIEDLRNRLNEIENGLSK